MTTQSVTQNDMAVFTWNNIELLESISIHSVPHFTRLAIGQWLEYEHPRQAMAKILDRNLHIETYSVVVNMGTTDGKNYDIQVFHPMGFLLIVMESSQPKAVEMKQVVAKFVYEMGFSDNPYNKLNARDRLAYSKQIDTLVERLVSCKNAMQQDFLIKELKILCGIIGATMPDLTKLRTDVDQLALV